MRLASPTLIRKNCCWGVCRKCLLTLSTFSFANYSLIICSNFFYGIFLAELLTSTHVLATQSRFGTFDSPLMQVFVSATKFFILFTWNKESFSARILVHWFELSSKKFWVDFNLSAAEFSQQIEFWTWLANGFLLWLYTHILTYT